MPQDEPVSQLADLAEPAGNDLLLVLDVSDLAMAPSGTDKQITLNQLVGAPDQAAVIGWVGDQSSGTTVPVPAGPAGRPLVSAGPGQAPEFGDLDLECGYW